MNNSSLRFAAQAGVFVGALLAIIVSVLLELAIPIALIIIIFKLVSGG
jgi:hypothetical protein